MRYMKHEWNYIWLLWAAMSLYLFTLLPIQVFYIFIQASYPIKLIPVRFMAWQMLNYSYENFVGKIKHFSKSIEHCPASIYANKCEMSIHFIDILNIVCVILQKSIRNFTYLIPNHKLMARFFGVKSCFTWIATTYHNQHVLKTVHETTMTKYW